jgi:heat shock protein HslJ
MATITAPRSQAMIRNKVLACTIGAWAIVFGAPGCTTSPALAEEARASPVQLEYENWMLEEVGGIPAMRPSMNAKAAQITFSAVDRRVSGYTGVNQFNGPYDRRGQSLTIGPVAMTRRAALPEWMEQEAAFSKALNNTASWRPAGKDRIELVDSNGWVLARFVREGVK